MGRDCANAPPGGASGPPRTCYKVTGVGQGAGSGSMQTLRPAE